MTSPRASGSNGRFLSEPEPGRERRQIVSAQRNEEHSSAHEDHLGRLCGLAPGGAGDEGRRRTSVSRPGSIQPVLEQSGGAGPSESEATNPGDTGIQAIRQRGGNDLRDRASREDQEGAVQDGQTRRPQCDDDGTVERGTGSLSPIRNASARRNLTDLSVRWSLHQSPPESAPSPIASVGTDIGADAGLFIASGKGLGCLSVTE